MFPKNLNEFVRFRCLEAARSGYPNGMSMYGRGIVKKGNKKIVLEYFSSPAFKIPTSKGFESKHQKICKSLGNKLLLNPTRIKLSKEVVAAKFLDTFLYQLVKFDSHNHLWNRLHLIIDLRVIKKLKKYGDSTLKQELSGYPSSPYEAGYEEYLDLQKKIKKFIQRSKIPGVKSKIDLNFLWSLP